MTHLQNVRDPHAMSGLIPFMEALDAKHREIYPMILAAKDNEGSRDAFVVRYSNAMDALRGSVRKLHDLQREAINGAHDNMDGFVDEVWGILVPQRKPSTDEHE
jgi:hypothetical protein